MWSQSNEVLCDRCNGKMSYESFSGKAEIAGCWLYNGWRCVSCGEIVDSQILTNRIRTLKDKKACSRPLAKRFTIPNFLQEVDEGKKIVNA